MTRYSVGLDIGISSVGWSIVDIDKKEIVDLGSRIFPSGNAESNQKRRSFRGARRLIRRRKNRLSDLQKILSEKGFPIRLNSSANVYELRVKALTEQLSREELSIVLYHLVKRRGISYDLGDLEDDGTSGVTNYKSSINENRKLLQLGKTVGEIQLERLKKYGQVRGQVTIDNISLLNIFPSSAYVEEVERILKTQESFYTEITAEFIDKIKDLIRRKRKYFHGPGSEKSRTDYGIYKVSGETLENLFSELIGKDKINGERRASASSLTAQIYNLLNDLNNLTVPNTEDGKLTTEIKMEILEKAKTTNEQFGLTQICKIIGSKKEEIKGFRIDKSEKPIIHTLSGYRKFRKILAEANVEANDLPTEFFDKVADILTLNTEKAEIRKQLDKEELEISDEIKEIISRENKNLLVDSRATWHSFSYKTLKLLIPELLNTSDEQMTILSKRGLIKVDNKKYQGLTKIPAKLITEEIYNPVVSKSTYESINVFNAISKSLGSENIEHVVIELPREDNEDDIKDNYIDFQKQQKKEKSEADLELLQQLDISFESLKSKYRQYKKLSQKVRFWYQQEGVCPYCGEKIPAIKLVNQNENFEIDHIIPISVSFDDSQDNKVICHSKCNQEKEKQTPLGWINNGGGFGQNKEDYKSKIKANKHYSKNKKYNLLNDVDLNDIEVRRSFISRNINDTRYSSKLVLNELESFFKSNNLPSKVKVVRGKWTSQMRKKWNNSGGLSKSRDTHHHHAIDASIIASFPLVKVFSHRVNLITSVDMETGEVLGKIPILSYKDFKKEVMEISDYPLFKQIEEANDIGHFEKDEKGQSYLVENPQKIKNNPVKFSHKVDKKVNREIANQTIYGTRQRKKIETKGRGKNKKEVEKIENYVFASVNIYAFESRPGVKGWKDAKKLFEKTKNGEKVFLMQEKDPKTWEKLVEILKTYPDKIEQTQADGKVKVSSLSPFELYRKENGFVTKYSKHNNGPKVKKIKYYDHKLGSHMDITPKNSKNKVILKSIKSWRTDVYYNKQTKSYELLGLKYRDLKYTNGTYGISQEDYEKLKYGIEKDGTILWKPISKESEF
ncbi:MAG: type II CRISPR RNA-guided endonuclease Cas9, partial [Lactovum sp.]